MLINIRQRLDNLKAISALAIFIAAPNKLDSVFKVALALKNSDLSNRMKEILLSDPQMQEMVEKRWQPQHKTLEELKAFCLKGL